MSSKGHDMSVDVVVANNVHHGSYCVYVVLKTVACMSCHRY